MQRRVTVAETEFSQHALPLVKATQKLAPTLQQLHSKLETDQPHVAALSSLSAFVKNIRGASRRCDAVHDLHVLSTSLAEPLNDVLAVVTAIPPAVLSVMHSVQAVRQELLQGGRGAAAAKAQAVHVVTHAGMADSIAALQALVRFIVCAFQLPHMLGLAWY